MPRTRHIYICIYVTLLRIDMDFLYQFNLGLIAPLFTVSFHEMFEKKKFFKNFKSWQVCDWLVKWIIMLRFMDLRWPRVFRCSNIGLVNDMIGLDLIWDRDDTATVTLISAPIWYRNRLMSDHYLFEYCCRADFRFVPSQWEMALLFVMTSLIGWAQA